jgi:hypothetical protein
MSLLGWLETTHVNIEYIEYKQLATFIRHLGMAMAVNNEVIKTKNKELLI